MTNCVPELMTLDEVARALKTTRRAIYSMIDRNQLPGVIRVRRRLLVDRADLIRWLESSRAPSPETRRR